jgi:imidazolonepropionase-like amidohydrolase
VGPCKAPDKTNRRPRRADEAIIPVRADLELWDAVDLHCAATAREGEETARVVTGIEEKREAQKGVWELKVELGG